MSSFNLFVYGTLRSGAPGNRILGECERIGEGSVEGILYDVDGQFPALLLYAGSRVHGEVWRCPAALLPTIDRYEGRDRGLFRRVGAEVDSGHDLVPCWVYTAGPKLSRKLTLERRIESGRWDS